MITIPTESSPKLRAIPNKFVEPIFNSSPRTTFSKPDAKAIPSPTDNISPSSCDLTVFL